MCGIVGKVRFNGAPVEDVIIARMCHALAHRGPNDQRIHIAAYIGLGQRRLAIIDLNREACAPLSNEDGTIWVVFNGEIYNFQALRERLQQQGHLFRTKTDTEVIVHLYEQNGVACLNEMRGMFAFALWDDRKKLLFIARDRLGKKPLFYAKTANSMIFGSEINALVADPEISLSPNFHAIDNYLTYQYVPSPETAFEGISKLPPAHYLICDADGDMKVERYWNVPAYQKSSATPQELESELLRLLRESVRLRLISDVPLGAFLSGGVDSATVVALMAEASGEPIKTFSIGLEDEQFNELPYAREVAQRYGTDHHEFIVKPDATEVLPQLVRNFGEPFADSSAIPTFYVSKLASQFVRVALSGDGGDENFCGYSHYAQVRRWCGADRIPQAVRSLVGAGVSAAVDSLPYNHFTARISRAGQMFAGTLPERYRLQLSVFKPQEKFACYTQNFNDLVGRGPRRVPALQLAWDKRADSLDWMMQHDQHYYLAECLMTKTDITAMANSLELRCPLLDHQFVEFAATIPSSLKLNERGGKQLFKNAVRSLIPRSILTKRKTGFGIPLAAWFRGRLLAMLRETLLSDKAKKRNLFNPRFVATMIDDHAAQRRDWSNRLWALLCLELWFREYID